ncbi:unnamed protein product, partial [Prunus brigantina]
ASLILLGGPKTLLQQVALLMKESASNSARYMGFLFWGFLYVVTCPFSISSLVCRCCFEGGEKRRGN